MTLLTGDSNLHRYNQIRSVSLVGYFTLLVAIAFWLRYRNLGVLGLWGDEDHTFFAVKGILENGLPFMPSDMFYPRAPLSSYLSAFFASILGLNEEALRLPSVLFSIGNLILYSFLAKKFFNIRIAIVLASLLTFSYWNIEMARQARMYEALLFFYGLSCYCYFQGFFNNSNKHRFFVIPLFLITLSTHQIGIFLNVFLLTPFFIRLNPSYKLNRYLLFVATLVTLQFVAIKTLELPYDLALAGIQIPTTSETSLLAFIKLNLFPSLLSILDYPNILFLLPLAGLFLTIFHLFFKHKAFLNFEKTDWFFFFVIIFFGLIQQFGILVWVMLLYTFRLHKGLYGFIHKKAVSFILVSVAFALFWGLWELFNSPASDKLIGFQIKSYKLVLKSLINYPYWIIIRLFDVLPITTSLATIGAIILFHQASITKSARYAFILIGMLGPLVCIGLFEEYPRIRYLYPVYPFLLICALTPLDKATNYCLKLVPEKNALIPFRRITGGIICLVSSFWLLEHTGLISAKQTSDRTYSSNLDSFLFPYQTHPDHKTPSLFVKNNSDKKDIVIVMDFISAAYSETAHYMLRTGTILSDVKATHEIFLGIPIVSSMLELKTIISERSGPIWLITSQELIGPQRASGLSEDVMAFLSSSENHVVYTGKDNITKVYLWR